MACGLSSGKVDCTTSDNGSCYVGNGVANSFGGAVAAPAGVAFSDVQTDCFSSCALATNGDVYCWGRNSSGILGNGTTSGVALSPVKVPNLPPMASIAMGTEGACGLTAAGQRWCWGANSNGTLGIGYASSNVPTPTVGP